MNSIPAMIRRYRQATGRTLGDVSTATGIAVSNLSRIESGRSAVRSDTLERIVAALGARLEVVPAITMLSLDDIRTRAAEGRRALRAAGLAPSDPTLRLAAKAAAGLDVDAEAETIR